MKRKAVHLVKFCESGAGFCSHPCAAAAINGIIRVIGRSCFCGRRSLQGYVWVWWRETKNAWFLRVIAMEGVFLLIFGQWYASRYFYLGPQIPFIQMMAIILGLWILIFFWGMYNDRKNHA